MIKKCFIYVSLLALLIFFGMPVTAAVVKKTDFNGDGKADLFVQNIFTGVHSAWLTNGSRILQKVSYGKLAPSRGWNPIGIKDVNGDNRTDLFFYNFKTGGVSAWFIGGGRVLQTVSYGALARNNGWVPAALEDFNGDRRADLLWYNGYTGAVSAWLISGGAVLKKVSYGTVAPKSRWIPIGAKDVNGDGRADLFWYKADTGSVAVWLIDGDSVLQEVLYGTVDPGTGWVPVGLEDLNGDRGADLLWYNGYTGAVSGWLINGSRILRVTSYGTNPLNSGWTPIALKDASGDGRADLLWYNANTGGVATWLINGESVSKSLSYGKLAPTDGWTPMGLDDFNGDGRIDIIWINAFTNATRTWLLNSSGILKTANYGSLPASSVWQVKIPGG
jgi:hypothetical protein